MRTTLIILFFTFIQSIRVQSQSVEWTKVYDWNFGYDSPSSISYIREDKFIFTGGSQYFGRENLIGSINGLGDTTHFNVYHSDSLVFRLSKIKLGLNNEFRYCKTELFDTLTWYKDNNNITKFDKQGNILWRTDYAVGYNDGFRDFDVLPDGSSLVAGFWLSPVGDNYLVRIDKDGNTLYETQFYNPEYQFCNDMEINKDGSIWISGFERPFTVIDYTAFMLKVDTDGNVISKDTIPNIYPSDTRSIMNDFTITPDGHILCFWTTDNNGAYLMKLDSNYNVIWQTPETETYIPELLDNGLIFMMGTNTVRLFNYANGSLSWQHTFPDTLGGEVNFTDYAFDDSGNVVLSAYLFRGTLDADMYFTKIANIGKPVKRACTNPAQIHWVKSDIINLNEVLLTDSSSEFLKYSDIKAKYWHFQDGTTAYGDSIYKVIPAACPTSFWAMLVVTDGVGCADTLTIDVCTGQILPNPEWPIPDTTVAIAEKNYKGVVIKRPKIYPNPTTGKFTVELNSFLVHGFLVKVYDVFGKNIQTLTPTNTNTVINLTNQSNGIYFIEITTDEFVYREKIVKE